MKSITSTIAAVALCASSVAFAADAPALKDNPLGAQYLATMPSPGSSGLYAQFAVMSGPGGDGVHFAININGKVFDSGPFLYHIHDKAVPSDGNCSATGAHLDPMARGENPPCDPSTLASCQVGDLSGKYGNIPALPGFNANYTDQFLSLTPGNPAFFGDKSIVIHYANKTRIACANFKLVDKQPASLSSTSLLEPSPSSSASGGFIGSTAAPTVVMPTKPATIAGGNSVVGSTPTTSAKASASASALSAASGMNVKHVKVILGPVLLGLACMV